MNSPSIDPRVYISEVRNRLLNVEFQTISETFIPQIDEQMKSNENKKEIKFWALYAVSGLCNEECDKIEQLMNKKAFIDCDLYSSKVLKSQIHGIFHKLGSEIAKEYARLQSLKVEEKN